MRHSDLHCYVSMSALLLALHFKTVLQSMHGLLELVSMQLRDCMPHLHAGSDSRKRPGKSKNVLLSCFALLKRQRDEVILPEVNNLMPGMVKSQQHRY